MEFLPFKSHRPLGSRLAELTALAPSLCPEGRPWGCRRDAAEGWPRVLRGLGEGGSSDLELVLSEGWLVEDPTECFAAYRIVEGSTSVIGLIGLIRVAELCARLESHDVPACAPAECVRCRLAMVHGMQLDAAVVLVEHAQRLPRSAELALGERPLHHFMGPERITHTLWSVKPANDILQWVAACCPLQIVMGHDLLAARTECAGADALAMVHLIAGARHTPVPWPRGGLVAWIDRTAP